MDTEYYRNFMAVVEAGNMTSAADYLHITQPTLSKQLRLLEKMYGTKLVVTERGRRTMYLTDAGKALYRRAKHICSLEDLAMDEVASAVQDVRGPLRFSISQGRSHRFIQRVLAGFHERYPQVRYELYEGIVTTQQEQLLSGLTDLGICNTELTQPEHFEVLFTREERMTLVASSDFSQFPPGETISLEELRSIPISISGGCAGMLAKELGNLEDYFNLVCISTTRGSAMSWAMTGKVAALVPTEKGETLWPGVQQIYLSDDFVLRKSIIRVADRPLPHVAKVFLDYYASVTLHEATQQEEAGRHHVLMASQRMKQRQKKP